MVGHHAPALRRSVVDVGGNDKGLHRAVLGQDLNALAHVVHHAGQRLNLAYRLRLYPDTAIVKDGVKSSPNGAQAHQSWPTWMDAHNFILIGPAGHELFNVGGLQCLVKAGLDFFGTTAHGGGLFFSFGHDGLLLRWVMILPCFRRALEAWAFAWLSKHSQGKIAMRVYAKVAVFTLEIYMTRWLLLLLIALSLTGCGYNDFQRLDEQIKSAWSEVLNQYQRRADLVPNIVATVKGEAAFEQETLTKVIEARAKATSIQVTPETLNNPEAFNKFQAAQGELGSALSRLMAVSEQYPSLKANQGFSDLRVQLEGTENRVTVARNRYIQAVQAYNVLARSFPSNLTAMVFSYQPKPSFTVQNEAAITTPPVVDFNKK